MLPYIYCATYTSLPAYVEIRHEHFTDVEGADNFICMADKQTLPVVTVMDDTVLGIYDYDLILVYHNSEVAFHAT